MERVSAKRTTTGRSFHKEKSLMVESSGSYSAFEHFRNHRYVCILIEIKDFINDQRILDFIIVMMHFIWKHLSRHPRLPYIAPKS